MTTTDVTTNLSEAALARLPKSVQQEIKRLVGSVDYWKKKATAGPEDSDTFADRIPGVEEFGGRPLGRRVSVIFQHGDIEADEDARDRAAVSVVVVDGGVEVRGAKGDPLVIEPLGNNTIKVRSVNPYKPFALHPLGH